MFIADRYDKNIADYSSEVDRLAEMNKAMKKLKDMTKNAYVMACKSKKSFKSCIDVVEYNRLMECIVTAVNCKYTK